MRGLGRGSRKPLSPGGARFEEASTLWNAMITGGPRQSCARRGPASPSPEDRFRRAERLAADGELEDAAGAFAACVAEAPDSFPARFDYGGVLRRLGRNDEAIEQLREARRLSPEDPDVHVELGLAYMATGATDDAIASFRRAIALDPTSPESRLHLPGLIEKLEESRPTGPR